MEYRTISTGMGWFSKGPAPRQLPARQQILFEPVANRYGRPVYVHDRPVGVEVEPWRVMEVFADVLFDAKENFGISGWVPTSQCIRLSEARPVNSVPGTADLYNAASHP